MYMSISLDSDILTVYQVNLNFVVSMSSEYLNELDRPFLLQTLGSKIISLGRHLPLAILQLQIIQQTVLNGRGA